MSRTTTRRTRPTGCYIGSEDAFQRTAIALVRQIAATQGVTKEAVMHIPNGGHRNAIVGAKLKGMGVVPGYPDIMVFHPQWYFLEGGEECGEIDHGLAIELKVWPNKPTAEQLHIHALLKEAGWRVHVCYGIEEVCSAAKEYFGTEKQKQQ